ncbi:patatin-like phospholipase family protein [Promicromonospora sp. NPDC060204]|uniref:patatin-like phospholipase family protein n=1 Tax=Promicromonospora sp. NPDC060204 TaxID=3347071 RepID=UPI00365E548E
MNTSSSSSALPSGAPAAARERALVLGGGGSTGNAWLIGVVAGLFDGGLDVTTADLTVGTSAGSTAAAQLAGATPAELYAATLIAPPSAGPRNAGPAWAGPQPATSRPAGPQQHDTRPVTDHMERTRRIIEAAEGPADLRRRLGAMSLDLPGSSDDAVQERWRTTVAARLPAQNWPERTVLLTAVDAVTGEPAVFDRNSGVGLADAVAASCASGFAYRIGSGRYIDGGYRAGAENADLAAGYARVLVLSPFGGRSRTPAAWGLDLTGQVADLRAGGSRVETIFPEPDAEHLFGLNAMDVSQRPAAARAGHAQGLALADRLGAFWR